MGAPQYVVAVPVSQVALHVGRRTRRWVAGKDTNLKKWPFQKVEPATQQWPRIAATGPGFGPGWVRIEREDGTWGDHRLDLHIFVEATREEWESAPAVELKGGYGTHPFLHADEPMSVPTEFGDQFAMF